MLYDNVHAQVHPLVPLQRDFTPGSYGGHRGGRLFLMSEVPLCPKVGSEAQGGVGR